MVAFLPWGYIVEVRFILPTERPTDRLADSLAHHDLVDSRLTTVLNNSPSNLFFCIPPTTPPYSLR